jgi:hypothetical protein
MNAWRTAIDLHFARGVHLDPARYTTVRYEDLVSQPRAELQRLCEFLGIPFQEDMLEFHARSYSGFLEGESHKMGTLKPVYSDSAEKWRESISPQLQELIDSALGDRMSRLGYSVEKGDRKARAAFQMSVLRLRYKSRIRVRRLLQMAGVIKPNPLGGLAEAAGNGGSS